MKQSPLREMFNSLEGVFEGISPEVLWKTAFFYKTTKTKNGFNSLIKKLGLINQELKYNDKLQEEKQKMLDYGFSPAHILLYLQAPEASPLKNKTTREEYLTKWNYENDFKRKIDHYEIYDRGKTATGALLAISGVIFLAGGTVAGFATNNKDIIDSVEVVSSNFKQLKLIGQALIHSAPDKSIEAFAMVTGIGVIGSLKYKSKIKNSLQENLYDKLPDNERKREKLLKFLNKIPKNEHNLLTHLSSKELEHFLFSEGEERYNILEKHPPYFNQRVDALLSDSNSSLYSKVINHLSLSVSPWNDKLSSPMSLNANNLKMQRGNMRSGLNRESEHTPLLK